MRPRPRYRSTSTMHEDLRQCLCPGLLVWLASSIVGFSRCLVPEPGRATPASDRKPPPKARPHAGKGWRRRAFCFAVRRRLVCNRDPRFGLRPCACATSVRYDVGAPERTRHTHAVLPIAHGVAGRPAHSPACSGQIGVVGRRAPPLPPAVRLSAFASKTQASELHLRALSAVAARVCTARAHPSASATKVSVLGPETPDRGSEKAMGSMQHVRLVSVGVEDRRAKGYRGAITEVCAVEVQPCVREREGSAQVRCSSCLCGGNKIEHSCSHIGLRPHRPPRKSPPMSRAALRISRSTCKHLHEEHTVFGLVAAPDFDVHLRSRRVELRRFQSSIQSAFCCRLWCHARLGIRGPPSDATKDLLDRVGTSKYLDTAQVAPMLSSSDAHLLRP